MTVVRKKAESDKKRLLKELEHLEKAHKSGIVEAKEYKTAKKSLERKIKDVEDRAEKAEAKDKAVKEILSKPRKKGSGKYFMKIEKPKTEKAKAAKPAKAKAEKTPKTTKPKAHPIKNIPDTIPKEPQPSPADEPMKSVEEVVSAEEKKTEKKPEIAEQEKPDVIEYKDIDELVEKQETNWRFALAVLTIFLLILLYIKFSSFGGFAGAVAVDAYLDYSSVHSHAMYDTLSQLSTEYEDQILLEYYLLGESDPAKWAIQAAVCAGEQGKYRDYIIYLFNQNPGDGDFDGYAQALGLDEQLFTVCLDGITKAGDQEAALMRGITHTPTVVINDKKIVGAVDYDSVKAVFDSELAALG